VSAGVRRAEVPTRLLGRVHRPEGMSEQGGLRDEEHTEQNAKKLRRDPRLNLEWPEHANKGD
jgi:hypothetical protein